MIEAGVMTKRQAEQAKKKLADVQGCQARSEGDNESGKGGEGSVGVRQSRDSALARLTKSARQGRVSSPLISCLRPPRIGRPIPGAFDFIGKIL